MSVALCRCAETLLFMARQVAKDDWVDFVKDCETFQINFTPEGAAEGAAEGQVPCNLTCFAVRIEVRWWIQCASYL